MDSELLEKVKKSQRLYFLALKFEDRLPKVVVEYAKKTCNDYTKMAKEMKLSMSNEETGKNILK